MVFSTGTKELYTGFCLAGMYMTLFSSTAAPPHWAPPSVPGKNTVFFVRLKGING